MNCGVAFAPSIGFLPVAGYMLVMFSLAANVVAGGVETGWKLGSRQDVRLELCRQHRLKWVAPTCLDAGAMELR